MNSPVPVPHDSGSLVAYTAAEVKAHVQRVQQVMKAVMKPNLHYGSIPGAGDKKMLLKPGAELLALTFHIAPSFRVEDLSDHDSVRYRVVCVGAHQSTGIVLGEGLGEASSNEEKYRWRNAVCDEEFNETPEDRRRVKWQRGRDGAYQRKQIRTVPADVGNTVLKMAVKRAQVAMTINVTAAGDIFGQDLEDMPPEIVETLTEHDREAAPRGKPETRAPQARSASTGNGGKGYATEKQVAFVQRRLNESGLPENEFLQHFGIDGIEFLPFAKVDEALGYIKQAAG